MPSTRTSQVKAATPASANGRAAAAVARYAVNGSSYRLANGAAS